MQGRRDEGKLGEGGLGWDLPAEWVEDSGSPFEDLDEEEEVDRWVRDG